MSMRGYIELQCDSLIGPTHHYGGLSHGNIASTANAARLSSPKRAALEGLENMKLVASLGIPQLVIPPQPRPNTDLLRALGFTGFLQEMLDHAQREAPKALQAAWSASAMWAANMATVSPAPDTADGKLHFSPANLASTLHRQQEAAFSYLVLQRIFGAVATIHPPLPAGLALLDEGAANHMRLCEAHGEEGVEVFVYGKTSQRYPCRQQAEASAAIARRHGVKHAVFVQQSAEAIDAGVFHNDVIAMSNEHVLIYHEKAFEEEAYFLEELRKAFPALCAVRISEEELPLAQAVASYFFNSQLLSLPNGKMVVIAPQESAEIQQAKTVFDRLIQRQDLPIQEVHYLDLRESMQNGGGPACLRLRVVMEQTALATIPQMAFYTTRLHEDLEHVISQHYPEGLVPEDLQNAHHAHASQMLCEHIAEILGFPGVYAVR